MKWTALVLVALLLAALAACGDDAGGNEDEPGEEITVFAASSLAEAFKEAGEAFEKAHPGTKVTFSFAASSALAIQISEGAPADVFASADRAQMDAVRDAGNAGDATTFARNLPVVVVPAESELFDFEELAQPNLRLVLAGESVPIGRYARQVFANASGAGGISPDFADKVLANLRSEEANVRAVLTKVQLGEADAGVVYETDLLPRAGVRAIDIPTKYNVVAEYPIAVLEEAKDREGAAAFVEFILGAEGQAILSKYGFAAP